MFKEIDFTAIEARFTAQALRSKTSLSRDPDKAVRIASDYSHIGTVTGRFLAKQPAESNAPKKKG